MDAIDPGDAIDQALDESRNAGIEEAEAKQDCKHLNRSYYDHMDTMAEPPYDDTDVTWYVDCDDCGAELARGDGYSFRAAIERAMGKRP